MQQVELYTEEILKGNRMWLSKAITLAESTLPEQTASAQNIIEKLLPYTGKSLRIGITGVPGVGKSTFIDALGSYLCDKGKKVAVLAIDPSSNISGGSILGDKTRMEKLVQQPHAFIRPSAAGKTLGGVAKATGEAILLCEAAGFDIVIVETVGVGQSETAVKNITDFFLLLMLAGAGDELQGMKRGIMEMADAIVINKADGDNLHKAKEAAQQYKQALHLFPPHENGWVVPVETASALTGFQIEKIWHILEQYNTTQANYILQKRQQQQVAAFKELLQHQVLQHLFSMPEFANKIAQAENNIAQQTSYAYKEAQNILAFVKEHLA